MTAKSAASRSVDALRRDGWTVDIVERWLPVFGSTSVRRDFLGCIDLIGVRAGGTIAVQSTTASNVAAHVRKLTDAEHQPAVDVMKAAGWSVVIHGWRKSPTGRWACRVVEL